MAILTPAQVYALARQAGLDPAAAVTATAIAIGESGLKTDNVGDLTIQTGDWGPSIGLWQIRSLKSQSGTGKSRDATRLKDPQFNARSMVEISNGGKNWVPWTIFKNGAYKDYLSKVTTSVANSPLANEPSSGNVISDFENTVGDATGAAVDAINPFSGWQNDVLGIGLKLAVTGAALVLVVAGVRATVNDKT